MKHPSKKIPLSEYPAERIALIKPSAVGDIVHALPVLNALRLRYPTSHITWIINRTYEDLLQGHPQLDAIIPFDRGIIRASSWQALKSYYSFGQQLRRGKFDLVIDLQGLLRTGIMSLVTGAPRRIGLGSAREGANWCYTDIVTTENLLQLHAVDRYWLLAEALGVGNSPVQFQLPVQQTALDWARQTIGNLPRPWLAFGVGARWETKRWPPEHFAELARRSQREFGGTILLIGHRDELPLAEQTERAIAGEVCNLVGKTSLPQLVAALKLADVMVANDTGPTHIAAALGVPIVAPYTCTKVSLHGPYGTGGKAIEADIWCQGSYIKKCDRLECMHKLTPDHLWPHLHEVLRRWRQSLLSA